MALGRVPMERFEQSIRCWPEHLVDRYNKIVNKKKQWVIKLKNKVVVLTDYEHLFLEEVWKDEPYTSKITYSFLNVAPSHNVGKVWHYEITFPRPSTPGVELAKQENKTTGSTRWFRREDKPAKISEATEQADSRCRSRSQHADDAQVDARSSRCSSPAQSSRVNEGVWSAPASDPPK